jgi:hypothetical protein
MIFNASYSSDFNPIENLFSLWKSKVHSEVHNTKVDLINQILKTSHEIAYDKKQYISSFVQRSLYFWKAYSDCQITDFLPLYLAQNIINSKKKDEIIRKKMRDNRKNKTN